jgi:hypothetical protein
MTVTQQVSPVTVPARPAARFGSILSIATITDGLPWDATGMITSFNCIGIDVDAVNCAGFKGLTKRFDSPSFTNGAMFAIQSGTRCKGFGYEADDPAIRAAFNALEPEGVSIGLHDTLLVNGTDITPATGPVTPMQALGLLESAGYGGYAGQPVIHLGPGIASQLTGVNVLEKVGDHLETHLGTPVAVASGVETKTGGKLDANQWGFVTGHVVLARSEVVDQWALDQTTNDMTRLFERLYVAAIDCLVAKVSVKVL